MTAEKNRLLQRKILASLVGSTPILIESDIYLIAYYSFNNDKYSVTLKYNLDTELKIKPNSDIKQICQDIIESLPTITGLNRFPK